MCLWMSYLLYFVFDDLDDQWYFALELFWLGIGSNLTFYFTSFMRGCLPKHSSFFTLGFIRTVKSIELASVRMGLLYSCSSLICFIVCPRIIWACSSHASLKQDTCCEVS